MMEEIKKSIFSYIRLLLLIIILSIFAIIGDCWQLWIFAIIGLGFLVGLLIDDLKK